VFVALVYWATLSGPAHAQLLAESALPGFDSRSSVVVSDRSPSLQTMERRHDSSADGDPTPLAAGSIATTSTGCSGIQPITLSAHAQAAHRPHSLAQPRAPPADAQALVD
jgi:hypothetical protein